MKILCTKNQWRIKHHVERNGNFYPTHGIGPVSFYMNIGRGDTCKYLTSMSSKEQSLSLAVEKTKSNFPKITTRIAKLYANSYFILFSLNFN